MRTANRCLTSQTGITLIEVMVTLLVVGIGLASIATLSVINVRTTLQGQINTQVTILADELADTMRANMSGYEASGFSSTPGTTSKICFGGTLCSAQEQAQFDSHKWLAGVAAALPAGVAVICMDSTPDDGQPASLACDGQGLNTIKLFWIDNHSPGTLLENEVFQRYSLAMTP